MRTQKFSLKQIQILQNAGLEVRDDEVASAKMEVSVVRPNDPSTKLSLIVDLPNGRALVFRINQDELNDD